MNDCKPFGELSREEQVALFEDWLDGKEIEHKISSGYFVFIKEPSWHKSNTYRIALTKPSINWDHVQPMYKYMATDKNGRTYLYTELPVEWESGEVFHTDNGDDCDATCFTSFKAGTCDWKDSLVQRPTVDKFKGLS